MNIRLERLTNGQTWFFAKDVCLYFGDTNYKRSLKKIDPEYKRVSQIYANGGKQNMIIINEAGLYDLCFQMKYILERQAKLKKFVRWVTHDVLPSIRKYGFYIAPYTLKNRATVLNRFQSLVDNYIRHKNVIKTLAH